MPDSQNKQGEQRAQCAICGIIQSPETPVINGRCGYCEADRRNALRRQGIDPDDSQNNPQGEKSDTPRTDKLASKELRRHTNEEYCYETALAEWAQFARQLERELSLLDQKPAPVSEIHGQIKAMLKRSEQYKREAENDGAGSEAEKHARVSSVLQELDRLATAFSEREAQQHAPSKDLMWLQIKPSQEIWLHLDAENHKASLNLGIHPPDSFIGKALVAVIEKQ